MEIRFSPNQTDYQTLSTDELRKAFLVDSLFPLGRVEFVYSDADRAMIGSAVPGAVPIELAADAEMRASYFCERRELGVLNIGASGAVEVDGRRFDMEKLDGLYLGRGSQKIAFSSKEPSNPAA